MKYDLSISLVVHEWKPELLAECLTSLDTALSHADNTESLDKSILYVQYNGPTKVEEEEANHLIINHFNHSFIFLNDKENLGYGGTNNNILSEIINDRSDCKLHLVMNPDIYLDEASISNLIESFRRKPQMGFLAPKITDSSGTKSHFSSKRYPSFFVLFGRMYPFFLNLPALAHLNRHYEYQDLDAEQSWKNVELCSGCFLVSTYSVWFSLGGFDEKYFMYFEDFDISMRSIKLGYQNTYISNVSVVHNGRSVGKKNWKHKAWMIRSSIRFFNKHGWNLWFVGYPRVDKKRGKNNMNKSRLNLTPPLKK